jgi:hypothetical protein
MGDRRSDATIARASYPAPRQIARSASADRQLWRAIEL